MPTTTNEKPTRLKTPARKYVCVEPYYRFEKSTGLPTLEMLERPEYNWADTCGHVHTSIAEVVQCQADEYERDMARFDATGQSCSGGKDVVRFEGTDAIRTFRLSPEEDEEYGRLLHAAREARDEKYPWDANAGLKKAVS